MQDCHALFNIFDTLQPFSWKFYVIIDNLHGIVSPNQQNTRRHLHYTLQNPTLQIIYVFPLPRRIRATPSHAKGIFEL